MRAFSVCLVLVLFVAMLVGTSGNPVGDNAVLTLETAEQPLTLFDVDAQQGHENEGDRLARGYGGYRGGYGGYRGGFGGYRGGYGGYRGGFGGYGGRRGGYYG
ncbi:TATA-binding protein-associated factor 2N-like [Bactrocera neohumeralis]|uniref:TATA-binding protein-associated factor 2N-like n=1 Tax=Bactrocera neohumeralis TaxID=98809 RepID=UPI002165120B|nr:TATA-binding protein-associated factor 2N-like [Bactrocera neohumeralis]